MLRFLSCLGVLGASTLAPGSSAEVRLSPETLVPDTIAAVSVLATIERLQDRCTTNDPMAYRIVPSPAPVPMPNATHRVEGRRDPMPNACTPAQRPSSSPTIPGSVQITPVPLP